MILSDCTRDGQSQPAATTVAYGAGGVNASEPFKDVFDFVRGDPLTAVRDQDLHWGSHFGPDLNLHQAVRWRVVEGVVEQVGQHLLCSLSVRSYGGRFRRQAYLELHSLGSVPGLRCGDRVTNDAVGIERDQDKPESVLFGGRGLSEVDYQSPKAGHLITHHCVGGTVGRDHLVFHPVDVRLDGELSARESEQVRRHARECWYCSGAVEVGLAIRVALRQIEKPRSLADARLRRFATRLGSGADMP